MPDHAIAVKNISRGPLSVDPLGMLEPGETGDAADTPHTHALIDAGSLLELPAPVVSPNPRAERAGKDKE